jgi:hypothetical protein
MHVMPREVIERYEGKQLPRPKILDFVAVAANAVLIAPILDQAALDGRLQPGVIVIRKSNKLERLQLPGNWAEHFR